MSRTQPLAFVVMILIVSACRPGAVDVPPPRAAETTVIEPTTTAVPTPVPTEVASPTPTAHPTPQPSPTPIVPPEEQIMEVHRRVMTELLAFDERQDDPIDLATASILLSGGLLDAVELLAERPSDGIRVTSAGFESAATRVELSEDGRSAQLSDCSRELLEFWGADGTRLSADDAEWRTRTSQFELAGGEWQMTSFVVGGLCQQEQP